MADKDMAVREDGASPVVMAPILGPADALTQATRIETGRAVAEVQAMVLVAQARPRDEAECERRMRRACSRGATAENAWYSYPRGGKRIVGLKVQVLRELLRCWGNAQSGVTELQRLPGRSEMQAWAWDMETNYRQVITFWWNHIRERDDGKGGNLALDGDRDIYELTTSQAARREREMIRRVLPSWFVYEAERELHAALEGSAAELPGRIQAMVDGFKKLGVSQQQIEERLGVPRTVWGWVDLNTMGVVYKSIRNRETTLAEEFPGVKAPGSAADSLAKTAAAQGGGQGGSTDGGGAPAEDGPPSPDLAAEDAKHVVERIKAQFGEAGWGGRAAAAVTVRKDVVAALARADQGQDALVEVASLSDLDLPTAQRVMRRLQVVLDQAQQEDPHERLGNLARQVADRRADDAQNPPAGA